MPVCELMERMPYAEFIEQLAYYRVDPWGDDWTQAGTMACASVAPHVKRRVTPQDFIPKPKRAIKQQTPDEIFGVMKQLAFDAEARRKARGGG